MTNKEYIQQITEEYNKVNQVFEDIKQAMYEKMEQDSLINVMDVAIALRDLRNIRKELNL